MILSVSKQRLSIPSTLFSLFLFGFLNSSYAQNLDSIRNVIQKLTFEVPVLSPVPARVDAVKNPVISLNGTWKFNPENTDFNQAKPIDVPGEWAMQGFQVDSGKVGTYWKTFSIPADWKGRRIKLRFDGVSSHGEFKLNGKPVGSHEGSFATFEFDVTDYLVQGNNLLEAAVQAHTISDNLACTSQYAAHTVGGILRKVTLYALPQSYISDFAWQVKFDNSYTNALLGIDCKVLQAQSSGTKNALQFELFDAQGHSVKLEKKRFELPVAKGLVATNCQIEVKSPRKWDPEHPNLYTLKTSLLVNGKAIQENEQKIGFRQIELRGNQFFVNNRPIKLRGVNRHEVHPLRGRSLTPELCRKDVELFRAGNCNYIRTSHYPPSEEFLQACDELGMFVESEASLCWIEHGASPIWKKWNYLDTKYLPYMIRADYENVLAGRRHPCIILWSLGNESRWSPLWERVNAEVKKLDPSRPTAFHDQCWGGYNNAGSKADVANYHYPGLNGPRECEKDKSRPTLFGEYMHVQCYARRELETDPSVRSDVYANTLKQMVDSVYQYPASLGGAIWSGIDDIFHLSANKICGYGPWGPIDGWRRPKPEYFGMKKSYAPVVVANLNTAKIENRKLVLELENRYNFTNLNELKITATVGNSEIAVKANVAPMTKGRVVIDLPNARPNDQVLLTFTDPRGFVCQEELVNAHQETGKAELAQKTNVSLTEDATAFTVLLGKSKFRIDKTTGTMEAFDSEGAKIFGNGARFMLVPHNSDDGGAPNVAGNNYTQDIKPLDYQPDENFKTETVTAQKQDDGSVRLLMKGGVDGKFSGTVQATFTTESEVAFEYQFETLTDYTKNNLLRQFGLIFSLPADFDQLEWEREGLWTIYPSYDINRLKGHATAKPRQLNYVEAPREVPSGEWKDDANKLGTNDFKSTKDHILKAVLSNGKNKELEIRSDGTQSARAWVDKNQIRFLVAGLNGPGSCHFFTGPRPQFKKGSLLNGKFSLYLK